MAEEFVKVYQAKNVTEAYLVKNLLEEEGIEAHIEGEYLQGALGDLPWLAISPRVLVPAEAEERARRIVEDFDSQRLAEPTGEPSPPWRCPGCGEEVDAGFEVCWNCQTSRPAVE